jgi:hypothetical protein
MVVRTEGVCHRGTDERGRRLAIRRSRRHTVRDVPGLAPGSPKATYQVRKVRPSVFQMCRFFDDGRCITHGQGTQYSEVGDR